MPAKRILLMYISAVSGHRSAAVAVEKAIKILSPQAETLNINAFHYTNPISEKIVNHLYMNVIQKMPKIWDYLYDNPKIAKNTQKIKETIHKFNSPKLKNLFDKFKPDAVVCTQAFPCGMVADFKKTYASNIPLVAVLTDYVPHTYWVYDLVDYYITPSEEVTERLAKKGISSDRIKSLGIPFDPKFNAPLNKYELMQKFKLDSHLLTVLIMGGGQGLGPIKAIVNSLEKVKKEIQEIIVTGTNIKLYNYLIKEVKKHKKKILLFSYSDDINELMSIADILITKPGGITTAEALAKKIPMIIVKPIPGQEANNAAYLTEKGAAIKTDNPDDINFIIEDLLANPAKLKRISESAASISKPNASLEIAKLLLDL
jgi:processive 1,2-diacylglycerol beta-glucosyltransferase